MVNTRVIKNYTNLYRIFLLTFVEKTSQELDINYVHLYFNVNLVYGTKETETN